MTTAKDKQESLQIEEQLMHDGIRPDVSDDKKIRHLYRKVLRTETNLRETMEKMEKLKRQQKEEMQAVEGYVEHIRNLSGEKDQLVAELERENDILKEELTHVSLEKTASSQEAEAIAELLAGEGMQEFAKGTAREQVSNLLSERARMLSDLTAGELKLQQLQSDLTVAEEKTGKDKQEYDELVRTIRQQAEEEKVKIKAQHEEMKKTLVAERDKQKRDAQATARKLVAAEKEAQALTIRLAEEQKTRLKDVRELKERHRSEMQTTRSAHERALKKMTEERDGLGQNLAQLNERIPKLEQEKASLKETVSRLTSELTEEREKRRSFGVTQGEQVARLTGENHQLTEQLSQTQASLELVTQERNELETRLDLVCKELSESKDVEQLLLTNLEEVKIESTRAKTQYENSVEDLSRECSSLQAQLQAQAEDLHQQTATVEELRNDLVQIEGLLDEERQQGETTKDKLETEVRNLKERLEEESESDAQEKRELQDANTELKELLLQSKAESESLQSDLAARVEQHSAAEHRADSVANEVRRLQEELERVLSERVVQDRELASQTDSLQTERERLAHELTVSSANLQKQTERADELQTRLDLLMEQNADSEEKMSMLANEGNQLKDTNRDLQNRLNTTEETKSSLNSEVGILKEGLSESREENTLLRREAEQLKVSNNQLQKQTRESQATYKNNTQRLQMDWNKEKDRLTSENAQLAEQLANSIQETNQLQQSLVLQERELEECRLQLTALKESVSNLEASVSSEMKMRQDLEMISAKKDFDIGKLRKELQENVEQTTSLEAVNKLLKTSLDTKSEECGQLRDELDEEKAAHEASQTERDRVESKLSQTELKVGELTSQVSEVIASRDTLEQEVQSTAVMRSENKTHREQMETFRLQLHHEQLERARVQQTAAELRAKLEAVQENDINSRSTVQRLQQRVSELETNFEAQKQKYRRVQQKCKQSEATNVSFQEEMAVLLRQVETQKTELALLNEEVDLQGHRYTEGKRRSSEKYITAREKYGREKRSLESSVGSLQDELELANRRLMKENEWRARAEEMHRELLRDKQQLVEKLGYVEDREREKSHNVRQLESHVVRLEQENTALQDRLQRVLKEKLRIETLIREPVSPEVVRQSMVSPIKSSLHNGSLSDSMGLLRTSSPQKLSPFSRTLDTLDNPSDS